LKYLDFYRTHTNYFQSRADGQDARSTELLRQAFAVGSKGEPFTKEKALAA
jgi:hypothetical protein